MNITVNIAIGRLLAHLRRKAGLTQVELAVRINARQTFVSKVETGDRSLHVCELYSYTAGLGMSAEELVGQLRTAVIEAEPAAPTDGQTPR